ncbi:MAG: hypothetical protein HKN27_04505 [Silicimonas sp.]|nr:hypothetical protein [Silicimonas sp.]
MNKQLFSVYKRWCKHRLNKALPGIVDELAGYAQQSDTTGTKWTTLWWAVHTILTYKPKVILECGTGASTIVFAAAIQKLHAQDATYQGRIISMESVAAWRDIAVSNLPEKYKEDVEIILGEREPYQIAFFRGYCHSNIPQLDYEFVFLDGPNYDDDRGTSFCGDILKVLEWSERRFIRAVVDTRVSSVFVLQTLFGTRAVRYYPFIKTCALRLPKRKLTEKITTRDFSSNLFGRIRLKKFE